MKISDQFLWTLVVILTVYGYFQGVVVPQTETKYTQQAVVASMDRTLSSGTVKSFPCNPTQVKCGKLVIKKDSVPDSYQDFTFVHQTIPGYPQTFTLDDDAGLTNPSALSNLKAFYTPYNATFLVSEVTNPGFIATVTCVDLSGGTTVSGSIANIVINQGESVTCTFKNVPVTTGPTACTPNTWTQKADFGGGVRAEAIGLSIGNKGYIGMGFNGNPVGDFWEYNPTTNVWIQKANFGGGHSLFQPEFSVNGKGYVITSPDIGQQLWMYNPLTNVWTQQADFPGAWRNFGVGFSIGNKGYVGTGSDGNNYFSDFWEYNPTTNLWTQKADLAGGPRQWATGISINGKGYIGMGYSYYNGNGNFYQDFWEYNPTTNLWTQKANYGGGVTFEGTGFSIGNKGYIGTGGGSGFIPDFWEYNPTTNLWTQKANYGGGPRIDSVGFSINGRGYMGIGRGYNNAFQSDFWEYCP